jgi:hypothetical protein
VIELIGIGDRVEIGRYRLRSRFSHALIFEREGHSPGGGAAGFACVVDESKGDGPINIVVRGADFAATDDLEVQTDRVVLGGVALETGQRYDSSLRMESVEPGKLALNLRVLKETLVEAAAGKSLVFLLDQRREESFASPFEKELARRLRRGVERLLAGKLEDGAAALKGLGFGLTPSGDDFLAGFLLGMHALQTAAGTDFSEERHAIYQAARNSSPFSDALLRCAAEGCYFQWAKSLVQALFEGASADVVRHAHSLLAVGASSGADLAVGLLFSLKTYSV